MIYLYDNAIAKDLENSFDLNAIGSPMVKVLDPEEGLSVVAQSMQDALRFPLVCLTRYPDVQIDKSRSNFTRAHRGVAAVIDKKTNELYYEKALPIQLNYDMTILTTNVADREELSRELLFKYNDMYFVTMKLPYESNRKVRFGITIDLDKEISYKSGAIEYLSSGKLYECIIPLRCEGAVLVSYTPAKLQRTIYKMSDTLKSPNEP